MAVIAEWLGHFPTPHKETRDLGSTCPLPRRGLNLNLSSHHATDQALLKPSSRVPFEAWPWAAMSKRYIESMWHLEKKNKSEGV